MLVFNLFKKPLYLFLMVGFFMSCSIEKDCTTPPDMSDIDLDLLDEKVAEIENYLDSIGSEYLIDPSGIRIVTLENGTGLNPDFCSIINLTYTASVLGSDDTFNSVRNAVFDLDEQDLIKGWYYGLVNLQSKGEYFLYVPSPLAYGSQELQNADGDVIIPANSNLVFRIRIDGIF